MPELSRFYGIIIRMFVEVGGQHHSVEESVMSHPIHRVASFELLGTYHLRVRFEDGAERTIDLEPVLFGALYGPLRDPAGDTLTLRVPSVWLSPGKYEVEGAGGTTRTSYWEDSGSPLRERAPDRAPSSARMSSPWRARVPLP